MGRMKVVKFAFVCFCALMYTVREANGFIPQIIEKIVPAVVEEKGTAYLNCTMVLRDSDKGRAAWYEGDKVLISYGDKMNEPIRKGPNNVDKYEVRFVPGRPSYVPELPNLNTYVYIYQLVVRFASEKDANRYKCVIQILGYGADQYPRAYGQVLVQRPPQITPDAKPVIVMEDEELRLNCRAEGSPPPVISWTKANGRPLPLENSPTRVNSSVLVLPRVTRNDRGVYRCYAQNNVGRGDEFDVMVEVNYKPLVRQARLMGAYAQAPDKNYQVTLECIINGYPDPDLNWYAGELTPYNNLAPLMNNQKYTSEKMMSYGAVGTNVTDVFYTLTIRDIKEGDYGNYTCQAKNDYGADQVYVNLFRQILCQGPTCPMLSYGMGGSFAAQLPSPPSAHILVLLPALIGFTVSSRGLLW